MKICSATSSLFIWPDASRQETSWHAIDDIVRKVKPPTVKNARGQLAFDEDNIKDLCKYLIIW